MQHWAYLAVLLGIVLGSLWLELGLRTRVLRRARRLVLSIAPVLVVFLLWDAYAIDQGHWTFDPSRVTGLRRVGRSDRRGAVLCRGAAGVDPDARGRSLGARLAGRRRT